MSSEGGTPDQIREPRPGRLFLIGLVLVVAAGGAVFAGVRSRTMLEREVTERAIKQATPAVELIAPQQGSAPQELVLPGDIQAFAMAPIYARASGYVTAWYKDIGDRVKRGDKLADIDTPDLDQQYAQAKADVSTALANATLAAATAKRYHELVGNSIISRQTDEEKSGDAQAKQATLESSRANLARLQALMDFKTLSAPFDGIVTTRSIDVGALINAGGTTGLALYQIADIHRVRVYARVPQAYIGDLREGTRATLRMPQYPGRSFEATLVGSSNSIAQESRTALIQLQADNPEGKLWPGTYTEVHFQLDSHPEALRIPATAVMFGERGIQVAVVDADDKVALKRVQLGRDVGSDVEILSGLGAGDHLIDSPTETLSAGDKVRVVRRPGEAPAKTASAGVR